MLTFLKTNALATAVKGALCTVFVTFTVILFTKYNLLLLLLLIAIIIIILLLLSLILYYYYYYYYYYYCCCCYSVWDGAFLLQAPASNQEPTKGTGGFLCPPFMWLIKPFTEHVQLIPSNVVFWISLRLMIIFLLLILLSSSLYKTDNSLFTLCVEETWYSSNQILKWSLKEN